jgi:hypothetical protein
LQYPYAYPFNRATAVTHRQKYAINDAPEVYRAIAGLSNSPTVACSGEECCLYWGSTTYSITG